MATKPAPTRQVMHGRTCCGPTAGRTTGESLQTRNGARSSHAITRRCGPQVGDVVVVNESKRSRAPVEELRFGRGLRPVPGDGRKTASGPCRSKIFGDRAILSAWRAGA